MKNVLTREALSAMGGASLLTFLIVQYTKIIVDRVARWLPTDLYAVMVAFIIFLLAGLALGQEAADWRTYILALANAFLVAADAGQLYEKALNPPGASKMQVLKDQAVQQRETKQSNTNQQAMRQ